MTFLLDTFTDADGTALTSHTGEIGASWAAHPTTGSAQLRIASNRAYVTDIGILIASGEPPGADYTVEADVYYRSADGNLGIMGRLDPVTATGYMFRLLSGSEWQLYRAVNGSLSLLDNTAMSGTPGATYRLRMELVGTTQRCYADDVLVCEAADDQITAAGRVGLRDTVLSTSTTGKHIDRLTAFVPSTDAPTRTLHPVLKIGTNQRIGPLRVGKD